MAIAFIIHNIRFHIIVWCSVIGTSDIILAFPETSMNNSSSYCTFIWWQRDCITHTVQLNTEQREKQMLTLQLIFRVYEHSAFIVHFCIFHHVWPCSPCVILQTESDSDMLNIFAWQQLPRKLVHSHEGKYACQMSTIFGTKIFPRQCNTYLPPWQRRLCFW